MFKTQFWSSSNTIMALKKVLRRAVLEKSRFDIFKCPEGETGGGVLHVPAAAFFPDAWWTEFGKFIASAEGS